MVAPRQLERFFDLRTVRRNIRGGVISKDRYEEWLKTLPDVADNVATVSLEDEEREARRQAPRFPVISPTRPLVSSPFDDDDEDDDDYDDDEDDDDDDVTSDDEERTVADPVSTAAVPAMGAVSEAITTAPITSEPVVTAAPAAPVVPEVAATPEALDEPTRVAMPEPAATEPPVAAPEPAAPAAAAPEAEAAPVTAGPEPVAAPDLAEAAAEPKASEPEDVATDAPEPPRNDEG